MRWIVDSSLKLRFMVIVIAAGIILVGITQLDNMPVDILPEFEPTFVEVHTEALGLSAEEVEQLITVPLEQDLLNGVPWLQEIRSESIPGLSVVVLTFEPGTDLFLARQVVEERLVKSHGLPNVSKRPEMVQPLSAASRIMMIGLTSKELSLIDISVLARWTIRPRLIGVPGVANVTIWGQRKRQLQVRVDPERLRDQNVTLGKIIETTGNALWVSPLSFLDASVTGTGGFIDTPNQRLSVRHVLPIITPEGLAQVSFEAGDGTIKLLGDVADVVQDHQPLIGDAIVNGDPGIILVVEKFPWANALAVSSGVEDAMEGLKPGLGGLETDTTVFRPATFIEASISNITWALIAAAILLIVVLIAFLFSWRSALISIVAIPASLISAVLVLFLVGVTMNVMVLAGLVLALSVIVDDAIIDVDNLMQRLRQRGEEGGDISRLDIIARASLEMRDSIVFATLIMALVLVPLFFIEGLFGRLIEPLVTAYLLALVVSVVVALTVTPALSLILLSNLPARGPDSPLVRGLRSAYEGALARTMRAPVWAYVGFAVIVALGLVTVPFLHVDLLPTFKERDLLVRWENSIGASRPTMTRVTTQVTRELRSVPGVRNVNAQVGRASMSDEVVDVDSGAIWVSVHPEADYRATVAAVRDVVDGYPELSGGVETYLTEQLREAQRGTDDSVVVRIYGQNLGILQSIGQDMAQRLQGIQGVTAARLEQQEQKPQIIIEADLARSEKHGIKPGDVRRAAAALVQGIVVGALYEEQKVFDVVVWGVPGIRRSLSDIRNLGIDTPTGGHVRLGDVADVRIEPAPVVIKHEAVSRYTDIGLQVEGRDLDAVVSDIKAAIQQSQFPLEYHAEVVAEFAERRSNLTRLIGFAVVSAIGVFFLMHAALATWRLAAMAFLVLPLALAGGLLAMFLSGGTITLGSLAGFLVVYGIAARSGIVLMRHYQQLEHQEGETFGPGLILRGTRERFAPILLTAIATILAMLPLVIVPNAAGFEILHPMAVVILGGAITSLLLSLFVIPSLYLVFGLETSPHPDTVVESSPAAKGTS